MGMAVPWLIKDALDAALQGAPGSLVRYPLWILSAAVLQGCFRYVWRINLNGFSRRAEAELRSLVFSHLQKLPLHFFQHTKTGDLMSRLTNDIQAVRELLGFGSLAVVDAAVVVSFSLSLMIAIDPWLTLWCLLPMPLISLAVRFFGHYIFRWSRDVQEQLSTLSAYVQESLAGIRLIQAYAQESHRIRGFHGISSEYLQKNLWLATLWGTFWPLMRVFSGFAATLVLWLGGRKVLAGTMSLGEFVAFNGYLVMLTWPLMAIGHVVNQYQRGTAALSRIIELLDVAPAPGYAAGQTPALREPLRGAIEFRDLTFAYDGAPSHALESVSVSIPAGTSCGIIGEVGGGKSTLVHLLLRLFDPPDGTVFIDGKDINTLGLGALREAIGFVSQDIFLFSGTIRENILFGCRQGNGAAVEEAARVAQLLPAVEEFSEGFETVLGERGVRLSGGQKQRTALARAVIKDPPILVLDDPFSSVDTETENEILKRLAQGMLGRTTLIISHRVSTVQDAEQILYLRDGRIVERGSHHELLALKGAYYRLYVQQQLAREVEAMGGHASRL